MDDRPKLHVVTTGAILATQSKHTRRRSLTHLSPGSSPKIERDADGQRTPRLLSSSFGSLISQPLRSPGIHHSPPRTMAYDSNRIPEEEEPLNPQDSTKTPSSRPSVDHSVSSASTSSLVLEGLNSIPAQAKRIHEFEYRDDDGDDVELLPRYMPPVARMNHNLKRILWIVSVIAVSGWGLALILFLVRGRYKHPSKIPYNHEMPSLGSGKKVTLDQVQNGEWREKYRNIEWWPGPDDEDGLLLEIGQQGKDFLVVEDIRSRSGDAGALASKTLMQSGWFQVDGQNIWADDLWPSKDLTKVLIISRREKNWRHSYTGNYWIFDVASQTAEPLDPGNPSQRIQLATWSPGGESIVFTRGNNMFLRMISSPSVKQITNDGGAEYFYGIPDWVYEEEVFQGNCATWWSRDGKYVAFLRTNETMVPEYPVQFFISRPSGKRPLPGEENYPEVREIKYPKAGAPNPVVDILFYDLAKDEVFTVDVEGGFADDDRLIYEILWANGGEVLIREGNRESDIARLLLVNTATRSGSVVRRIDVAAADGGWIEPAQLSRFIPADPANGRPHDGYVDTVYYQNYDHLAYFTPLDNPDPIMLTSGEWEVVTAPSAVDIKNNLVYFQSTQQGSTERHIYSVKLDGTELTCLVPTDKPGYYDASFSEGSGYMLLNYGGPGIPSQSIQSTPSHPNGSYSHVFESNAQLAAMAADHELPTLIYSTITTDDNTVLNVIERRPKHFDASRKYPVLFQLYGGPGSQQVNRKFKVDFQSYIVSSLDYVVVTVDGRGTGFIGRAARTIVRGDLGHYEAIDQINTAKLWATKPYVDETRMAIWGWSYGGFMTLKVLEMDAGETFKYGMSVAPVTDWKFYDSVYTERYMMMPQHNAGGYASSAIQNVTAISQNVRWLIMHGVADDNVHMQNTLTLLDKFDLAQVENYDVHIFPDSDHSIFFHSANRVVYDKLSNWLINAFNGEFYKIAPGAAVPNSYKLGRRMIGI